MVSTIEVDGQAALVIEDREMVRLLESLLMVLEATIEDLRRLGYGR